MCYIFKKRTLILTLIIVLIGFGYFSVKKRINASMNTETALAYRSQSNALLGKAEWLSFDMQWELLTTHTITNISR